jgi:uncharacterized damage-inducible protein DinB
MDLESWLRDAFAYDHWATTQWLECFPKLPEPNQAEPILAHIVRASEIWLSRVNPDLPAPTGGLNFRLDQATEGWIDALQARSATIVIEYRTTTNQPFKHQLGAIAGHVINHGTYHRGQLRAIADEQGFIDFPESDMIGFIRQNHIYEGS